MAVAELRRPFQDYCARGVESFGGDGIEYRADRHITDVAGEECVRRRIGKPLQDAAGAAVHDAVVVDRQRTHDELKAEEPHKSRFVPDGGAEFGEAFRLKWELPGIGK